jgi:hypothetical protein
MNNLSSSPPLHATLCQWHCCLCVCFAVRAAAMAGADPVKLQKSCGTGSWLLGVLDCLQAFFTTLLNTVCLNVEMDCLLCMDICV